MSEREKKYILFSAFSLAFLLPLSAFADISDEQFMAALDYVLWFFFSPFFLLSASHLIMSNSGTRGMYIFLMIGIVLFGLFNAFMGLEYFGTIELWLLLLMIGAEGVIYFRLKEAREIRDSEN